MKPDTMRKVDYLLGIPLCFLADGLMVVKHFLFKTKKVKPAHVLFIELSEMGSAILANPAMEKVKKSGCIIYFLIFKSNIKSLYLLNTVAQENIFAIRDHSIVALMWDTLKFLRWSRRKKIDSVLDLELFSRYTALLTGFSGAKNRIGFYKFYFEGLYRGKLLTRNVLFNPHIHISKNFLSLVHALFAEQEEFPFSKIMIEETDISLPKLVFSSIEQAAILKKIQECSAFKKNPIVVINPNASDLLPQRRWPQSHFKELLLNILQEFPETYILLTGAATEFERIEALKKSVDHSQCLNFSGKLSLTELPILYSMAVLMVTNDSGPAHFASITHIPIFILFGPETPKLYGALGNATCIYAGLNCSPCVSAWNHRKTSCQDNICLQRIDSRHVMSLIRPVLLKTKKEIL